MPIILSSKEVENQSNQVFDQFGEKWKKHAKMNVRLPFKDSAELGNVGIGKYLVLAAMGESLEDNIDVLRKYRFRYDIITCDKGFGTLLEQGIKADYVMICDSNIPYKWIEPYIEETQDVKLICTPYANVEWTHKWKGELYFYVSKDAINTEEIFGDIFGGVRLIPASSNVSNAMLVYFLGVDDKTKINFGGYEKYLLVGYDYSWRRDGNYYAFSNPMPKRHYMCQNTMLDIKNEISFTSENLLFSAKWMFSYLTTINMPVINCSEKGILCIPRRNTLENELCRINPDKRIQREVKSKYDEINILNIAYEEQMKKFNHLREGLVL